MAQIEIDEKYIEYFNRGVKYLNNRRHDKALQFFKKSLIGLKSKEVYLNLGNALAQLDRDSEAIENLAKAAHPATPFANGISGPYDLACNNLGLMKYRIEELDSALELYTQAIELGRQAEIDRKEPFNGDPYWNYANAYLRKLSARLETNWNLGWNMYKYRFNRKAPTPIDNTLARWDGVSQQDTIVVLSEQGIGDKIQFGRYLQHLKKFCKNIVVQVPSGLNCLFQPQYVTVEEDLSPYRHCVSIPFCDLAQVFGWDSSPAEWVDMTKFTPRTDLGDKSIIVEWSGNTAHANDRNRSTTPELFLQLQKYGNLYSFRDKAPKGIIPLNSTANWIESCNAILGSSIMVTVDTSVVHMCGTLGHPCIMLQPLKECDWRWGTAAMGRENLWYPSVKIARNPCNWKKAFDEVHNMLEEHFAENKQT